MIEHNPNMKLPKDESDLIALLRIAIDEEHFWHDQFEKRTAYFTALLSAIVAAVFIGVVRATDMMILFPLFLGSLLLVFVSRTGIDGVARLYQRFLEAIVFRAYLEQKLEWLPEDSIFPETYPVFERYSKSRAMAVSEFQRLGTNGVAADIIQPSNDLSLQSFFWPIKKINVNLTSPSVVFVEGARYKASHEVVRRLFIGFYVLGLAMMAASIAIAIQYA